MRISSNFYPGSRAPRAPPQRPRSQWRTCQATPTDLIAAPRGHRDISPFRKSTSYWRSHAFRLNAWGGPQINSQRCQRPSPQDSVSGTSRGCPCATLTSAPKLNNVALPPVRSEMSYLLFYVSSSVVFSPSSPLYNIPAPRSHSRSALSLRLCNLGRHRRVRSPLPPVF